MRTGGCKEFIVGTKLNTLLLTRSRNRASNYVGSSLTSYLELPGQFSALITNAKTSSQPSVNGKIKPNHIQV